ncbi:MAG TPA: lipoprotein [Rhodocyclaceae bacterium]|nr:lipoprotein [Rhodocyclaceae bacterium]
MRFSTIIALVGCAALLNACGIKGPLVLPPPAGAASQAKPAPATDHSNNEARPTSAERQ